MMGNANYFYLKNTLCERTAPIIKVYYDSMIVYM